MPETVVTTTQTLKTGLVAGFTSFMHFLPALFGALIVLAIGWFVSKLVATLIERVLVAVKFEHAVVRSGVHGYLPHRDPPFSASHVIGQLAKWFVFLIFVQAAANILGMPQVTDIINSILLFLPNVLVALVILVAGVLGAKYIGELVEGATARMGLQPRFFSLICRYAIIGFAAIAAINQLGIATNLINILFTGLTASLALALGLAFGLGGRDVAGEITRGWYDKGKDQQARLRSVSGSKR